MRVGKKLHCRIIVVYLLVIFSTVKAKTIYVDASADPDGDGSSWAMAYKYLQDALHDPSVEYGDEIWVAEGTYYPDEDESGNVDPNDRTESFTLINGVALYGGFPEGGGGWGERDPNTYVSILSGDLGGNDRAVIDPADLLDDPNRAENSYHVVTTSGTDPNVVLDGFTVSGGNANGPVPDYHGGGIYGYPSGYAIINNCKISGNFAKQYGGGCYKCNGSITNCTFTDNLAELIGGGLYDCDNLISNCMINANSAAHPGVGGGLAHCDGSITNCTVKGNSAGFLGTGGGFAGCNGPITNCKISGNRADYGGGLAGCNGPITNCLISGNLAVYGGGGLIGSNGSITNCTFYENSANYGGGMYTNDNNTMLTNCTFTGNTALNGNSIACDSPNQSNSSTVELKNCILWNNGTEIWNNDGSTINISYSDIQDGWPGIGNINEDPLFADPNNGDFHLKSQDGRWNPNSQSWVYDDVTSRCIDAGNPGMSIGVEYPDPENIRINLGAYGGTAEASRSPSNWSIIPDINNDGVVEITDYSIVSGYFGQTGENLPGDFNHDGIVDVIDLAYLAANWLKTTIWYMQ